MEKKSKIQRIKEILLEKNEVVLMEQMKTKEGDAMLEADPAFEVGASIFIVSDDDQKIALPVNDPATPYELEDGRKIQVVEEGVIAEVMEAGDEEEVEEPAAEEEMAAKTDPEAKPLPKSIIESVSKETKFSSEELESKIVELEAKIVELSTPKVEEEKEEVTEVVELNEDLTDDEKAELIKLAKITPNPESKVEKKTIKPFGGSRELSIADKVMLRMAELKNK